MLNRLIQSVWLVVFSMLLVTSIQDESTVKIVIESIIILMTVVMIVLSNDTEKSE